MNRISLWWKALFRPNAVESELREEILHHLELEVQKNLRSGMTEREARREAMLAFGGVDRFQEQAREARSTRSLENILADLKHSIRGLRKAPGFTATVVLTLAIGIGANTAIFSVVSGVLLRPLPFPQSEELVFINSYFNSESGYDFPDYPVGSPEYFEYRDQNRSMEGVAAASTELITITDGDGDPEVIAAGWVSPSLFTVLRTPPLLGRTLLEEDGGPQPNQVAVLSYDLWQSRFGGDSTVVGRRVALGMEVSEDPVLAEIVGVMPRGFAYPREETQLWGPLPLDPARTWRGGHWFDMVGRLAPGVSLESARAEMAGLMGQWALTYPDHHVGHGLQLRPLLEEKVGQARPVLLLLLASVGFVLLIACANVASLLLARAEGRRREMAVRNALGAGRSRLFQQTFAESVVLAVLGGGLGLLLAWGGVKGVLALEAGAIPRVEEVGLDLTVLAFTAGVIILTTVLVGFLPALRESAANAADALRKAGIRVTSGAGHIRFRKGLVVAEVALGVILVVGAGLLVRSFQELLSEDPGFATDNLHFAYFSLPAAEYTPEEGAVFFEELVDRTRALPMVASATLSSRPPLLWTDQSGRFHIQDRPAAPSSPLCCVASGVRVGEDFFETMGVTLVEGRLFQSEDHLIGGGTGSVLVDRAAAERWWPGENPIGQNVVFGSTEAPWNTVVGVVENVTYDGPGEVWPTFYTTHNLAVEQAPFVARSSYLVVRTRGDEAPVLPAIRQIVGELDPGMAIANTYTMQGILDTALARPRFIMSVISLFAAVALVLGAIGIYGVLAYGVALRAGEIGIRRALGAEDSDMVLMILKQGLALTGLGLALGLGAALAGSRFLQAFLHGVTPTDPFTLASVVAGISLVALAASYIPASRASGVDPLDALKLE